MRDKQRNKTIREQCGIQRINTFMRTRERIYSKSMQGRTSNYGGRFVKLVLQKRIIDRQEAHTISG